ncbi:signal transduction histidine kinase [Pararhizobium capsulatum DSM 1112]|uniref:histidine kinase n=1 Tax=Pararhizobium capsulatum DSM 1112 TaxID=1121113 RepID=A0ABU0BUM9_9HYPH|nr:response regulator [Pararhizobium capsulatum]MDQ0321963.1 signal transduction histidine kinase [Pararhizobium capsulatum DSM 1112]
MNPVTFLLVDDLEENLLSLEALLRREGLLLLKARSGDQALELLLQHDIALALIDVQMPGLNGFELAELMRGNERSRRVPIIFVTAGTADNQRRFRGYEAGAVDFIQKPIEPDVLRSKADVFFELFKQRQQIAAQRDELEVQAEALREADRRKDEFLATLAHELRNPLAPLRHGLDILRRNPNGDGSADVRDMMDRQLVHLVRIIDDLLDVSRVSQGKIELIKDRVKVDDVIRSAVETAHPLIEKAGHALTVNIPSAPIWIDADYTRLSQVVANLLNNAIKYTPAGGQIGISVATAGNDVVIDVSDNGVGIPAEMRSKVFQLFAQVDDHLDRAQGGLGIGLALVQQLVAMHGGTVEARGNDSGSGSVFRIRLPISTSAEQYALPCEVPSQQEQSLLPLKVLVVDDNVDVAYAMGWMLEEIGYEYELVHDGREALQAARYYKPDVILLDIGLPGMNGYEVCQAFRQDELFKDTTIIAQTGWGQDRDKALASEAGFNHHLTKPVSLDDLGKILATAKR